MNETELTWNKMLRESRKTGFREGASEGNDISYQKDFDIGYEKGFEAGFSLGNSAAKTSLAQHSTDTNSVLEARKGSCKLCGNPSVLENG